MEKDIIQNWFAEMVHSVVTRDLDAHMALVSKQVQVYGLPGRNPVDYRSWLQRRNNEFSKMRLRSLHYDGVRIKTIGLKRLAFSTKETMTANDGSRVIINKDIMLQKEEDQQWRVIEETINDWHVIKPDNLS